LAEPCDQPQERGLPGAVGARQQQTVAGLELEVDVGEGPLGAEANAESACVDQGLLVSG